MTGTLILVRHGQTAGNANDQFTGLLDPDLTAVGVKEAIAAGALLAEQNLSPDRCYVSALRRSRQTLDAMLAAMESPALPIVMSPALNERDYGQLAGMSRDIARARWGAEQVQAWRRGYDDVPPGGESLKQTFVRVASYYEDEIVPHLVSGKTILIVAHGNSLRVLVMAIEGLSADAGATRELATGEPLIYRTLDERGRMRKQPNLPSQISLG